MSEQLAGQTTSGAGPQRGQRHRSSNNFTIDPPSNYNGIRWECPGGITFSVKEDIRGSGDPVHFSNLTNGSITIIPRDQRQDRFYISDPQGAGGNFDVKAYAMIRS